MRNKGGFGESSLFLKCIEMLAKTLKIGWRLGIEESGDSSPFINP